MSLVLNDQEYNIRSVPDWSTLVIAHYLKNLSSFNANVETANLIKTVLIPDIPDIVIGQTSDGRYYFACDAEEIVLILTSVIEHFYKQSIQKSEKKGDATSVEKFKRQLESLNKKSSVNVTPLQQQNEIELSLRQEIDELKSALANK